jgi:protease I
MTKKVALIIAHEAYHQVEYNEPKKALETAGFTVIAVSNKAGTAKAKDNSTASVNKIISDLDVNEYAGIFFIGGPGALEHLDNQASYKIIQAARASHIPIGAICISTRILAHANILQGIEATGWNDDNKLADIYRDYKISYAPVDVMVCDGVVTATGPSVAKQFGDEIVTLLTQSDYKSY